MKKLNIILLILMLIFSTSCSKNEENINEKKVNNLEDLNSNKYSKTVKGFTKPKDWAYKTGMYGEFYSDFKDVILINEKNMDGIEYENIVESLNFYRPDFVSLSDEIVIENNDKNIKEGIINSKKYLYVKIIESDDKIISLFSEKKESLDEMYKKVFK